MQEILDLDQTILKSICDARGVVADGALPGNARKSNWQVALLRHCGFATAASQGAPAQSDALCADAIFKMEVRLQESFTQTVQQALGTMQEALQTRVKELEANYDTLQAELTGLKEEKKELHASLSFLHGQFSDLQGQVCASRAESAAAADAPYIESRRPNLMLHRLPEVTLQVSAEQVVPELLSTIGCTATPKSITYIKPSYAAVSSSSAGPPKGGPVRVCFASAQEKDSV